MDESMENNLILLDSSILIDYFRKKNKEKSAFVGLAKSRRTFAVSVITRFEVLTGSSEFHREFWNTFFEDIQTIPITVEVVDRAIEINRPLKSNNKLISFPDLLIAATAVSNDLPFATLNAEHFNRIPELKLFKLS